MYTPNALKEKRKYIPGIICIYCGAYAGTREHFPPKSFQDMGGYTLPACFECNVLAGLKYPYDFHSRAKYVKSKLKSRYAKFIKRPIWNTDDLDDISENIRESIRQEKILIGECKNRINWDYSYYATLIEELIRWKP